MYKSITPINSTPINAMLKPTLFCFLAVLSLSPLTTLAATEVVDTQRYLPPGSDRFIYKGTVQLPAEGRWQVDALSSEHNHIYLAPSSKNARQISQQNRGNRITAMQAKREENEIRYTLQSIVWPAAEYARQHEGIGPAGVDDLDPKEYKYAIKRFSQKDTDKDANNEPSFFLLPRVQFNFAGDEKDSRVNLEERKIVAIALHSNLDDGKHWHVYTDHSSERRKLDQKLLDQHGLQIQLGETKIDKGKALSSYPYSIITQLDRQDTKQDTAPLTISLRNKYTGATQQILWQLSGVVSEAASGDASLKKELDKRRRFLWKSWYQLSNSPVLAGWLQALDTRPGRNQNQRNNSSSIFAVMGGRAAVRETLQMQLIGSGDKEQPTTIDIDSIQGVTVKSHPFEEMLAGQQGGSLPLADLVPADNFFLYVAKPESLLSMLDDGAAFLSRMGGTVTRSSIKYLLKEKYLSRLGLNEQWIDLFLRSETVKECAIIAPDLFFIDGTDVTVISRLANPEIILPMLRMIKVSGLTGSGIVTRELANGRAAFWAIQDDLLIVSTSRKELENIIELAGNKGKNSLGQSSEFRYMLTQLPVKPETRAYAYLSDPFIRKLVGPKTKINQMRRMIVRTEMEQITARALLAKLDGISPLLMGHLIEQGYIAPELGSKGYVLDKDLVVHSPAYGTVKDLTPLTAIQVDQVSQQEADGYKQYLDRYNNFWRRFFDPIAIRLDNVEDNGQQGRKGLEASVFILPLIDNTIYNSLKEFIVNKEEGSRMRIPVLSPSPVLLLSLNLKEEAWVGLSGEVGEMLARYARINPAFIDDLGPALHLAINDADPVIALGSGDLLGAFGGSMANIGGGSSMMMMLPAALAALTRPCTLAVETSDPEATRRFLMNASRVKRSDRRMREMSVEFFQVTGEDSWIFSFDIMGMIKLRYGIEVRDGFLMISNIPWAGSNTIEQITTTPLNGARLAVYPGASKLQLAGLHAAAVEHQSAAAMEGAGLLYPLLESGYADIDTAAEKHRELFGFMPVHPGNGTWQWQNRQVVSNQFGSIARRQFPKYQDGDSSFGLMRDIEEFNVQMQFEDSGLRTKVRWTTAGKKAKNL